MFSSSSFVPLLTKEVVSVALGAIVRVNPPISQCRVRNINLAGRLEVEAGWRWKEPVSEAAGRGQISEAAVEMLSARATRLWGLTKGMLQIIIILLLKPYPS